MRICETYPETGWPKIWRNRAVVRGVCRTRVHNDHLVDLCYEIYLCTCWLSERGEVSASGASSLDLDLSRREISIFVCTEDLLGVCD